LYYPTHAGTAFAVPRDPPMVRRWNATMPCWAPAPVTAWLRSPCSRTNPAI